ncbi:transglycosylase domain-containing protein [Kineosporia sp. J2-2]|uniref:Transglycosylase domain-containing protein n=1 Tax=Kineosporia corallincola TaxID=2835133 RepID=A0ABS5TJM2_9ACTN|nr:transglycosylase domain-containing protein [Kineosporia corallincola]MBT0771292.1 transglycosylase domain-containing protein [Kineosporia corallincola]
MERPSGPSRRRPGPPDGEANGRDGLGGRRLGGQQSGNGLGGQRSTGGEQPGLGGRRLNAQQGQSRQGLGGHRNSANGNPAMGSRPPADTPAPQGRPPQPSRRSQQQAPGRSEQPPQPMSRRSQQRQQQPPSRSEQRYAESRSVAPPETPSRPPAPGPYERGPRDEQPLRPRGTRSAERAPERPSARPVAPASERPYSALSPDRHDDSTAVYGASPYAELGPGAQSPDELSRGRRMQNRLRDSQAGRILANTGALNMFMNGEGEQLDSKSSPPRRSRARQGGGGGRDGEDGMPPQGYRRYLNYPRWGKAGVKRWLPSWKLVTGVFSFFALLIVGVVFWFYNSVALPAEDPDTLAQTTTVYYSDQKTVLGKLQVQNRESVELAQVPDYVRKSVLAAEDNTFYSNSGVNPTSIVRAVLATVSGGNQQGGSTISQQYVKNVYNQKELSYKRKLNEAVLAIKINRTLGKDKILERYLNTIYWGRGAWGIQAASKTYFNKDVSKLTKSEGAFLAGIINAPEAADPRDEDPTHAERAERRWGVVLDAMVGEGWLDASERAQMTFPKVIKEKTTQSTTGQAAYLMEMVKEEAAEAGFDEKALTTGGYNITTTFNKRLVTAGQKAVKEWTGDASKNLRVGMASINPSTGGVLAIYGGTDINKQLNQATKDRAQAASTFKAFGLVAALKDGVSLKSYYDGNSGKIIEGVKVSNFGNEKLGQIDLVKATAQSVNTVYVALNSEVGPEKSQQAAIDAGIPKDTPDLKDNLVNVLGSANVHPIDMADAYSTFAAQGVHRQWHVLTSIANGEDKEEVYTVPEDVTKGTRVFDKDVIADATYALQHVVTEGSGSYAKSLNRPIAGKTGSSTDNKSAWFIGYTPQVVTAVALHQVGKDGTSVVSLDGFGGFSEITGGTIPTRIWTSYMEAALKGKDVVDFPDPAMGGQVTNASPTPEVTQTPTPTVTETQTPTPTVTETQQQPTPDDTNNWQTSTPTTTETADPDVTSTDEATTTWPGQDDDDDDDNNPFG